MSRPYEFPTDGADVPDATFPPRKVAPPETQPAQNTGNSQHHYRITVDKLDALQPGEGGTESISFFATTPNDLFVEANQLRHRLCCSACTATKLALGRCLLSEQSAVQHPSLLVVPTET
jgi:hypothetical protein